MRMYRLQAAYRLQRDCTLPCTAYEAQILYFLSSEKITGADNTRKPCMHFNGGLPSVLHRIIHTPTEATSMPCTGLYTRPRRPLQWRNPQCVTQDYTHAHGGHFNGGIPSVLHRIIHTPTEATSMAESPQDYTHAHGGHFNVTQDYTHAHGGHFNGGIPSVLHRIIHTPTEATSMAESPVCYTGLYTRPRRPLQWRNPQCVTQDYTHAHGGHFSGGIPSVLHRIIHTPTEATSMAESPVCYTGLYTRPRRPLQWRNPQCVTQDYTHAHGGHFNGGIPSVLHRIIHTPTEATSVAESPVCYTGLYTRPRRPLQWRNPQCVTQDYTHAHGRPLQWRNPQCVTQDYTHAHGGHFNGGIPVA